MTMSPSGPARSVRIGIDTGGTFTDIVLVDGATGALEVTKVASTPANPALGLVRGVAAILAASNRNLETQIQAGKFREDLFYRLNVVELNVPPLRERREDILPLAAHFLTQLARGESRFSSAVTDCLVRYAWPGNVRELRNALERASLLSGGGVILPEHLPGRVQGLSEDSGRPATTDTKSLSEIEEEAIAHMLQKHNFNRSEAAKALGISRRALTYKLQQLREAGYQIDPE